MANGHGGKREGSGMPSKWGQGKTRVVRIPETMPIDQIMGIPELSSILDNWQEKINTNPDNPRYYYLIRAIDEIRALGY